MKNIVPLTLLTTFLFIQLKLQAQNDPTLNLQLNAMKKMEVMVGEWKGNGWMQQGNTERKLFHVTEKVLIKNSGVSLLVEGIGESVVTGEVIHDALATIHFDARSSNYQFNTHLAKGMHQLAIGTMNDNVFTWGFQLANNATIKYTITFTDNQWNEIGEYSPDSTNWYQFLEMNLTKIED